MVSKMKMSDVFENEIHFEMDVFNEKHSISIFDEDKLVCVGWSDEEADAICHAINMHDELVDALEKAIDLADRHDVYGCIEIEDSALSSLLTDVLERAKGK